MENVVSLNGKKHITAGTPNPKIIEAMEKLLQDAKDGKMQSFAVVALDGQGAHMCDYSVFNFTGMELLGAIEILKFRMTHQLEADT